MNTPKTDTAGLPESTSDTLKTAQVTTSPQAGYFWNDGKRDDDRFYCEQYRIDNAGIGCNHRLAR